MEFFVTVVFTPALVVVFLTDEVDSLSSTIKKSALLLTDLLFQKES